MSKERRCFCFMIMLFVWTYVVALGGAVYGGVCLVLPV